MLGSPCFPCCCVQQRWTLLEGGNPNYWTYGGIDWHRVQRPNVVVENAFPGTPPTMEADWYLNTTYQHTEIGGNLVFSDLSRCRMRGIVGYNISDGSHAFIEFETEGRQYSQTTTYTPSEEFTFLNSSRLFGVSEVLPTSAAATSSSRYSYIPAADFSQCFEIKAIRLTDLANRLRWVAVYKFFRIRIGYSLPDGEVELFATTVPSCLTLSFWASCDRSIFSVGFSPYPRSDYAHYFLANDKLRSYAGTNSFSGAFSVPSAIANGDNTIGFGLRAPVNVSPRSLSQFGTGSSESTDPKSQIPSSDPPFAFVVRELSTAAPSQRWRLPCGDGFPGASEGYAGGEIDQTLNGSCLIPVKQPTSGQLFPPNIDRSTILGEPVYAPFPLASCDATQQQIHATISVIGRDGNAKASAQAAWNESPTFQERLDTLESYLIAEALSGTHALTPVAGNLARWSLALTEDMTSSIVGNEPYLGFGATYYHDATLKFLSGRIVIEMDARGILRWDVFGCVELQRRPAFGGGGAWSKTYSSIFWGQYYYTGAASDSVSQYLWRVLQLSSRSLCKSTTGSVVKLRVVTSE